MNEVTDAGLRDMGNGAKKAAAKAISIAVPILAVTGKALLAALTKDKDNDLTKKLTIDRLIDRTNNKDGAGKSYDRIKKQADKKGQGLESVPISDKNMLEFNKIARQYKIQYGLFKEKGSDPPTWQVHFMAKDSNTMAQAFKQFTHQQLNRPRTFAERVKDAREIVAQQQPKDKYKQQERSK